MGSGLLAPREEREEDQEHRDEQDEQQYDYPPELDLLGHLSYLPSSPCAGAPEGPTVLPSSCLTTSPPARDRSIRPPPRYYHMERRPGLLLATTPALISPAPSHARSRRWQTPSPAQEVRHRSSWAARASTWRRCTGRPRTAGRLRIQVGAGRLATERRTRGSRLPRRICCPKGRERL